jgi:hypothetical protein
MDIERLTTLFGADADEVERLVLLIEQRPPDDRSALLRTLARALRVDDALGSAAETGARPAAARRTDVADAVAVDLGFD